MSIEELKQILFQGGCWFMQIGIECPPKEGEHCQECIDEVVDELIGKIREDAIDEFAELLLKHKSKDEYPIVCVDEFTVRRFVEQLKEKKNE